jgi:hypothetical protein
MLLNLENHSDTCILLNHTRAACFKLCAHASSSANPIERVTTVGCEDKGKKEDHDERLGVWLETRPSRRGERSMWWCILLRVCILEVLLGEQRNHMGWVTLDVCACYKCYQENKGTTWGGWCWKYVHVGNATRRTKEPHGVVDAAKCTCGRSASKWPLNSHTKGRRCREREGCWHCEMCVCYKCYQLATVTVTLEGGCAGEIRHNFKFCTYPLNYPTPRDSPA